MSESSPLADFPVVVTLPILWGDQDAFGHVNNVRHIRWFESSRVAYLEQSGLAHLMTPGGTAPILVSITCNYRRQLLYPDTVRIGARVAEMGRTSKVLEHLIFSDQHQAIAADGQSTLVLFDFQAQRPVRISEELRTTLTRFERRDFPNRRPRSAKRDASTPSADN